jgi:hypothetical protein
VPVAATLEGGGTPRVWALLPATWLAASGAFGAIAPRAAIAGTPLDAWGGVCDYARWDTDAFTAGMSARDVWLFDRVTAMYRGYAITGDLERCARPTARPASTAPASPAPAPPPGSACLAPPTT